MEKRNVPKLRFKGFEDEWEKDTLGKISRIIMGQSPSSSAYNDELEGIPLVQGNADIYKRVTKPRFYTSEITKRCEIDDIIMSVRAPVGTIAIANQECCIGRGVCSIKSKMNQEYLYQVLLNQESKWKNICQGSTFESINSNDIKNLVINTPSLAEQTKIANFLSNVDKIIEEQEGKVKDLELYKKGMMQKIFKQEIRFKDDNGQDYPEWEEKKLSEVLTETKAKNTGDLKVCSVAVKKGVIDQIEHLGRSFAAKDTSNYKLVKKGDLIYTKSPTGKFPYGIVKQSFLDEDVIVSPLYGVFEPMNYFLGYILHSYFYYKENTNNYLHSIVQKGAKNTINISNETFLSKKIRLPINLEEQTKIANFLSNIDKILEEENKKLEDLRQWKKGLLQQMFV
ncbi:restriction endonuclease subunit S [Clostridium saudiense]|uniref:restriction endonuclease subunit S n=1 Tax=Clostridium saudiense TaxID=1414720 RepID=UPI0018AA53F9|nr:restriction endonuclease subunit S [Clostridium saudiense]